MITQLLQIDTAQFSGASPLSTAVYGVLVAVLVAAVLYLAKQWAESRKEYKELSEKTLVVLTEVKDKVLDQTETRQDLKALITQISELKHYIELNLK